MEIGHRKLYDPALLCSVIYFVRFALSLYAFKIARIFAGNRPGYEFRTRVGAPKAIRFFKRDL